VLLWRQALPLARFLVLQFDGVISEALGIDPSSGGIRDVPGGACTAPLPLDALALRAGGGVGRARARVRAGGRSAAHLRPPPRRSGRWAPARQLPAPPSPIAPSLAPAPVLVAVYPPAVIVSMTRDEKQAAVIAGNKKELQARGTAMQIIKVGGRGDTRGGRVVWARGGGLQCVAVLDSKLSGAGGAQGLPCPGVTSCSAAGSMSGPLRTQRTRLWIPDPAGLPPPGLPHLLCGALPPLHL
jgi:hypothetical protein